METTKVSRLKKANTTLGDDLNRHRQQRELHALIEVAKTLTAPIELDEMMQAIIDKIIGVVEPAQIGAVMIWDQPRGLFQPLAAFGYDLQTLKKISLHPGESVTGKTFQRNCAQLLKTPEEVAAAMQDMLPENREIMKQSLKTDALPISTLAVPITMEENKYGVLVLETLDGHTRFTEADIPFVQALGDLIALAIERHRLREKLDAAKQLREEAKMRAELMAALSHELRLPLTAIRGYTSALLLPDVNWSQEKQLDFLQSIENECEHMESMITEMLDSSIISVDQLNPNLESVQLQEIAREVAEEIQRRSDIHRLVVDFDAHFPKVNADVYWIKQVFRNLLDNAVKYSPEGGLILIRGELRAHDVLISISDQGIGIAPEDLIPLFEKYYRAQLPPGYRIPGTGLGLPIARSIVEAHHGRIWIESKVNEGTIVNFTLPIPEETR